MAHDPGLSMLQVRLTAEDIGLVCGLNPADAQKLISAGTAPSSGAARWSELEARAARLWTLECEGRTLAPRETRVEERTGDNVSVSLRFSRPAGAPWIGIRAAALATLPPEHREFALVTDGNGRALATKMLTAADNEIRVALSPSAGPVAPAAGPAGDSGYAVADALAFIRLGIQHIWTGYDHLLFLLALLIVCGNYRAIMAIITCFTVAHSLTLALATLEIVHLPGRLTEAVIAASIVFIGVENLLQRGNEPRWRRALTFAFGLIHGFGFAGVLRDLGLGADGRGVALPLFAFNLGVELGQVAIASAVLPLVWWLRKNEAFVRRGVPAVSAVVALAGFYWLIERTLFT